MQESWRKDGDKLTFIACLPLPSFSSSSSAEGGDKKITAGEEKMIGDVNLFLSPPEVEDDGNGDEEGICTGELELMIADPSCRRKGYGRGAVLSFMMFIERNLEGILKEFLGAEGKARGLRLRVKIGGENEKSIGLFEGLGFKRVGEGVNYFGECELRFGRVLKVGPGGEMEMGAMEKLCEKFKVVGYRELKYVEVNEGKEEV